MKTLSHREQLIHILQMAYSGEKAAALAYAGHWRASFSKEERDSIARIEQEEWIHRAQVLQMLRELGSGPIVWREIMMGTIGSVIFFACFISGWYFPMYFAGLLEHSNVHEYLDAAELAAAIGHLDFEKELLHLADVETTHEDYFKQKVYGKCLTPMMAKFFSWGDAPLIESTVEALVDNR